MPDDVENGSEHNGSSGGLTAEQMLSALTPARRQHAVRELCAVGAGRWTTLPELARRVAGRNRDRPPVELSEAFVDRAAERLHNAHLTPLAELGVVDVDEESDPTAIRATDRIYDLAGVLDAIDERAVGE
jgi:hypothetical protein